MSGVERVVGAPRSLRRTLLAMIFSLIAPAIVVLVVLAALLFLESQRGYERQLLGMTRALALAADRQMLRGEAVVQTLAASPALAAGDLATFETQAREAAADETQAWVTLSDARGQVFNTRRPSGEAGGDRLPSRPLSAEGDVEPRLSDLFSGPFSGEDLFAIDRTVLVAGEPMRLSYVQDPEGLQSLFLAQRLNPTWTATIADRAMTVVARSQGAERFRGLKASPDFRQAVSARPEGVVLSRTLAGTPTLSAFSRSARTGWTFVVGVPRSEVFDNAFRGAAALLLIAAGMIGGGAFLAWRYSLAIGREVQSLAGAAAALSERRPPTMPPSRFAETEEVRLTLDEAWRRLSARDAEAERFNRRQSLMINELNHRVKNSLATVQSLVHHSFRGREAGTVTAFEERLMALSRAHDLLTRQAWDTSPMEAVVRAALEPYQARVRVRGPEISLPPNAALALTMILHELATNAAKYGALSVETGLVTVDWRARGERITLTWRERGGPKVSTPKRQGFGARLIEQSARMELNGAADVRYEPEGVVCVISMRPGAAPAAEVNPKDA